MHGHQPLAAVLITSNVANERQSGARCRWSQPLPQCLGRGGDIGRAPGRVAALQGWALGRQPKGWRGCSCSCYWPPVCWVCGHRAGSTCARSVKTRVRGLRQVRGGMVGEDVERRRETRPYLLFINYLPLQSAVQSPAGSFLTVGPWVRSLSCLYFSFLFYEMRTTIRILRNCSENEMK